MTDKAILPRASVGVAGRDTYATITEGGTKARGSALSWGAVLGGTVVATAITLVLVVLGSGLGLAWVSPLRGYNPSLTSFTITAAIWLIVVQWVASGMGGYITGRLRTRWQGTHSHEVFFRDTAHGLLSWAASTLLIAALVSTASAEILGSGVRAAASATGGAARGLTEMAAPNASAPNASAAGNAGMGGYEIDGLFRPAQPDATPATAGDARAEARRLLARGIATGDVPAADRTYLAQLIAAHAGIPQVDAQKRVDDLIAQEKTVEAKAVQAADAGRKAASLASIFTAVSLLIGAFIACAAAAFGGSLRDEHP